MCYAFWWRCMWLAGATQWRSNHHHLYHQSTMTFPCCFGLLMIICREIELFWREKGEEVVVLILPVLTLALVVCHFGMMMMIFPSRICPFCKVHHQFAGTGIYLCSVLCGDETRMINGVLGLRNICSALKSLWRHINIKCWKLIKGFENLSDEVQG